MNLGWRALLQDHITNNDLLDVYEFGVYTGKSMQAIAFMYNKLGIPIRKFFGLDSFEGLPAEKIEPAWQECWGEGEFDSREWFNVESSNDCVQKLRNMMMPYEKYGKFETVFIKGFYEYVLDENAKITWDMKPAHYVDIDVDIYSSTKTVLDFMFQNKLIVPGTIIGYDDWGGSPGWVTRSNGESRAHAEAEAKYNVEFQSLAQWGNAYPHIAKIFKVVSIG